METASVNPDATSPTASAPSAEGSSPNPHPVIASSMAPMGSVIPNHFDKFPNIVRLDSSTKAAFQSPSAHARLAFPARRRHLGGGLAPLARCTQLESHPTRTFDRKVER